MTSSLTLRVVAVDPHLPEPFMEHLCACWLVLSLCLASSPIAPSALSAFRAVGRGGASRHLRLRRSRAGLRGFWPDQVSASTFQGRLTRFLAGSGLGFYVPGLPYEEKSKVGPERGSRRALTPWQNAYFCVLYVFSRVLGHLAGEGLSRERG